MSISQLSSVVTRNAHAFAPSFGRVFRSAVCGTVYNEQNARDFNTIAKDDFERSDFVGFVKVDSIEDAAKFKMTTKVTAPKKGGKAVDNVLALENSDATCDTPQFLEFVAVGDELLVFGNFTSAAKTAVAYDAGATTLSTNDTNVGGKYHPFATACARAWLDSQQFDACECGPREPEPTGGCALPYRPCDGYACAADGSVALCVDVEQATKKRSEGCVRPPHEGVAILTVVGVALLACVFICCVAGGVAVLVVAVRSSRRETSPPLAAAAVLTRTSKTGSRSGSGRNSEAMRPTPQ